MAELATERPEKYFFLMPYCEKPQSSTDSNFTINSHRATKDLSCEL